MAIALDKFFIGLDIHEPSYLLGINYLLKR